MKNKYDFENIINEEIILNEHFVLYTSNQKGSISDSRALMLKFSWSERILAPFTKDSWHCNKIIYNTFKPCTRLYNIILIKKI